MAGRSGPVGRRGVDRHSVMARRASTTTTATPPAPMRAPMTAPRALAVDEPLWFWRSVKPYPMNAPSAPEMMMATKPRTRAVTDGSAVGPEAGPGAGPGAAVGRAAGVALVGGVVGSSAIGTHDTARDGCPRRVRAHYGERP